MSVACYFLVWLLTALMSATQKEEVAVGHAGIARAACPSSDYDGVSVEENVASTGYASEVARRWRPRTERRAQLQRGAPYQSRLAASA